MLGFGCACLLFFKFLQDSQSLGFRGLAAFLSIFTAISFFFGFVLCSIRPSGLSGYFIAHFLLGGGEGIAQGCDRRHLVFQIFFALLDTNGSQFEVPCWIAHNTSFFGAALSAA